MEYKSFTYRILIMATMLFLFMSVQAGQNSGIQHNRPLPNNQSGPRSSFYDHILVINVNGNGFNDITRIAFGTAFTDTFDSNFDAVKLTNRAGQPTLYTLMDTTKMAINAIPDNTTQRDIITGFLAGTNGTFSMTFDSLHTFDRSALIFWEDRNLHTLQNLRSDSTYSFTSTTTDSANRFVLHFLPPITDSTTSAGCGGNSGSIIVNLGLYNINGNVITWDSYVVKNALNQTVDTVANANGIITSSPLPSGSYTVQLKLNGYTVNIPVTIASGGGGSIVSSFSADSSTVHIGSAVTFTNFSTGATSYTWNFGDNTTSSLQSPPTHTYATTGTYTVTLVAINGGCSDTVTHNVIVVNNPTVVATSTAAACGGTGAVHVNLDQFQVDNPAAVWDLYLLSNSSSATVDSQTNVSGTVTTSNLQPGIYTINLTRNGHTLTLLDTVTQTGSITASFVTDSAAYHVGGTVVFTSTSTGAGTYLWDFGDQSGIATNATEQHTYTAPGTYTVTLVIHNGTCTDSTSMTVEVRNNPVVSSSPVSAGCGGNGSITVNLDVNNVDTPPAVWNTYVVANSNGATVDSQTNVSGTVTSSNLPAGTYTVTVTRNGNSIVLHDTITQISNVSASFTVDSSTVHAGNPVTFTSTSSGAATYFWNFGDGDTTNGASPLTHTYAAAGTYTVTLVVTNNSCSDSVTGTVTVLQAILPGIAETETPNVRISSIGNTITIFPNGFTGENASVRVCDVLGREIFTAQNVSISGNRIDIKTQQNLEGYYFVRVMTGNHLFSGKVLLTNN